MVMFAVTLLTTRILELNESHEVRQFCTKNLKLVRITLEAWWVKLENIILNAKDAESEATKDVKILNELLLQTAVCSAYTFNVSSERLAKYVIIDQEDIVFWLCTVSRMYHMVVREKAHKNFSKLLQNLVRDARLRIPLKIESYLHQIIQEQVICLHDLTCQKWSPAKTVSDNYTWARLVEPYRHVHLGNYYTQTENGTCELHTVYIDLIRGIFLVDGYPPSYLPENIIQHDLFNRFFKHCRFQVQRDSKNFSTNNKYMNHHYTFYFTKDSELIIRQLADDSSYLELVPPLLLSKHFSKHFIEDFTHWYSSRSNQLEFKNRSEDIIEYYFCPEMKLLMEHSRQNGHYPRKIFSINSEGFKKIAKTLSRLEYEEFIDVSLEENLKTKQVAVSVNLRRLNLTFRWENGKLHSKNFSGFYIASKQCFGTLTGLKHGLLLEKETIAETSGFKKLFLIQHGIIQIGSLTDTTHQSVIVDSTSLRKPTIFTFEVDQILNRLKAGNDKSAWLYLAALHASTSSPFPDEFTGLTGTEMAMWILQSGCIFSCSPYDEECLETFKMIHRLSPQRVYYPHHLEQMQTIKWPSGLEHNSYATYDGFGILVDDLIHCSNRLKGLYPRKAEESNTGDDEVETSPKLRERSYYRHLNNYNQVAHLKECFVKCHCYLLNVQISLNSMRSPSKEWMQLGKVRMNGKLHFSSTNSNVESLIVTTETLPHHPELPPVHNGKKPTFSFGTLNDWFSNNLRDNWLHLYTLALQGDALEHEFTFILGAMLYFQRGSLEQALNLHNISRLVSTNQFPSAVDFMLEFEPTSHNYVQNEISEIVKQAAKEFPDSQHQYDKHSLYLEAQKKFEKERDKQIALAACAPASHWPSEEIQKWVFGNIVSEKYLDLEEIKEKVDQKFAFWYNNLKLKQFVNKVDQILDVVRNAAIMNVPGCHLQISRLYVQTAADDADTLGSVLADMKIVEGVPVSTKNTIETEEEHLRQLYVMKAGMIWGCLHEYLHCTQISKALNDAGIHIRLTPVVLLRKLLEPETSKQDRKFNEQINELAICFTNLKRLNRLIHYRTSDIYSVELERELASEPFENWDPLELPEWLLLELELNVTIRPIQVDVAKHMMNMDGGGVTQLNMGEGKTSVIVPMIVSTLSARDDLVCRVTVLSSIFTTNFNLLTFTVGGLLNKRLYSVPCRRDYKISQFLVKIDETYLECMKMKGVIMTLPEYRLSFRLMMYNYYLQEKHDFALQVYNIEKWLREHVRDIVDESDEVFSVKYQLIYTSGDQENIGGGNLRWIVCQRLLQILPEIASKIFDQFGENAVEFNKYDSVTNPEQFTPFRILSDACKSNLYDLIAEAILQGKIDLISIILNEQEKILVKAFLTDENISEGNHKAVLNMAVIEEEMKMVLLIISGYLRHGVLFTALTKRWRVECGVNGKGEKLMAVPFRAKDVAAERTEFGHPDMAIVLTQLSYYYSGLNDEQLMETFSKLKKMTGPESLYNGWIQKIPHARVHDSIKTYKGINLLDFEQRTKHLFPVLRKHKAVIDFWLENCVYPKESKQFPRKLVMNAWDLSYEKQIHPTTGFSGTNDTKLLLPATISQKDLGELQKTNEQLEATLQQTENGWRRSLAMATTCENILKNMKDDGLRVLIDAGALILDGNEAVASLWLQVDEELEGVVYFNDGGELVIKTRSGSDAQLKLSSYNDRLEQCAVYLDDYHTRGTDLKLPNDFKACVTIGSRMRRDKLMQACMRMRKLGKGQSVHFYLSHEANNKILEMINTYYGNNVNHCVSTGDILSWTKLNSCEFEKEGLVYWAASAKNYTQKLAADEMFEMSDKSNNEGELLAKRCEDKELLSLEEIYGTYRSKQKLVDIIPRWFLHVEQKLINPVIYDNATPYFPKKLIQLYKKLVQRHCKDNVPNHEFQFSMLEEEQEKELEPENETEDNTERPPFAEDTEPNLHQSVLAFVKFGGQLYAKPGIVRLSHIFENTTFWSKIQPACWGSQLYATEDFVNVIINPSGGDSFLRPMSYITSWAPPSSNRSVLLLSTYEVNELMPLFHSENQTAVTLHMFSGRYMEGQDILVNQARLQLPISQRGALLSEEITAPLLIAAGNLFYASMKEQKAFAQFVGLHPRPWQTEDQEAFENGLITCTGFVLPNIPTTTALRQHSLFQKDATGMVRAILQCRNDVLRDSDHTKQLLNQRAYVDVVEEDVESEE